MKTESSKALLDVCYQAKRIRELLPALPDGVSPSFIQYLDVIEHLQRRNVCVKISDISDALNIPPPRRDPHRQRHGERHSGFAGGLWRVLPAFESGRAQKTARNRINREKAEVMRLRFVFWSLHPAASPPPLGARFALNSLIFRQCDPRDRRSHPPVRQGRSRWRHVRQGP